MNKTASGTKYYFVSYIKLILSICVCVCVSLKGKLIIVGFLCVPLASVKCILLLRKSSS